MKTQKDNLIRRLSALLLATALALLMIWGGSYVRADDMEVSEIASETDASPTDASTESTTAESMGATTTEVVQSEGFSLAGYSYNDIQAMFNIDSIEYYTINATELQVDDYYWGKAYNDYGTVEQGTLYSIGGQYLGYCIEHTKQTAPSDYGNDGIKDGDGTPVKAISGKDYFGNTTKYQNMLQTLYCMSYEHDAMYNAGFMDSPNMGEDNANTKHDYAICAFTLSYFNGVDTDLYNRFADVRSFVSYVQNHKAVYSSYEDDSAKFTASSWVAKKTNSTKFGETMLMSEPIKLDASVNLVYNFTVPADLIVEVYNKDGEVANTFRAGEKARFRGGETLIVYAKPSKANSSTKISNMQCEETLYDFVVWEPTVMSASGSPLYQSVAVFGTGEKKSIEFEITWEGTASVKVKKASSNPDYTNGNACYSLAGTEYRLYTDSACTNPATDVNGQEVVFMCDANGDTVARDMAISTYYLKETKAGKGYIKDERIPIATVTLTAEHSVNPYVINVTNKPVADPVEIVLSKAGRDDVKLKGAIYCVEFYPGVQSYNEESIKTTYTGSPRKWYLETNEYGVAQFRTSYLSKDPNFPSDEFYYNAVGTPTLPLGSVIIYEAKAPGNYRLNSTHYTYKVLQITPGSEDVDIFKLENGQDVPAGVLNASNELEEGFTDEPLFADLTIKKVPTDPMPAQGNDGDVTFNGAIFAVYAKRDVIDTASGEIAVTSGATYAERTALTYEDGTPVQDVYGRQLYAEAGDLIPVVIMPATDENGETTVEGLYAAANADDYFVKELAPPKGFVTSTTEMSVDLRDNTDKTAVLEAIEHKYEFGDDYLTQPIEIIKYTVDDSELTPKLVRVNDVEFQIYLISDLKNKDAAVKFIDNNGKPVYDFSNYDFSEETPVVLKQNGSTKLVMGSGGVDGYDKTEPLIYGEYVVVESYTPEHLESVAPQIISLPKYRTNSDGSIQFDTRNTPVTYEMYDHSVLNEQVEKLVKVNKKDEDGNYIIHSNATFSVWDVSDLANADTASIEEIKTSGKRVEQFQITPMGYEKVNLFNTNSEGFIIFFQEFKYGKYAVIEEKAPEGYTLAKEPVLFDVKSEALYLLMNGEWEEATKYYDASDREYWEVTVTNVDYEINVAKVNSESGDYLPDAEMTIFRAVDETGTIAVDEDNNPVVLVAQNDKGELVEAVWTTSKEWIKFNAVPSGYYVLRETKTPTGFATREDIVLYVGDEPSIAPEGVRVVTGDDTIYYSFDKREDGVDFIPTDSIDTDSIKVEVAVPNDVITVELSKKDASTDQELPGAELTLYRVTEGEEDEFIETWVSESTPHVVKGLQPGKYKLEENTVPLGYYTEDNTIEFEVSDTNVIQKQYMLNHPLELKITKESFKAGTPITGATLAVYRLGSSECTKDCDFDPTTATKTDAETGEVMHLVESWVSDGTEHTIIGLYPGEYVLVEEEAPYGYTTADPIRFTVTDQSRIAPIAVYDELIDIRIQIHKTGESLITTELVESEYGEYTKFVWDDVDLEGVQFDVKNADGEVVATLITDKNGIATSDQLEFGDYSVEEQVPFGMVDEGIVYKVSYKWLQGMQEENLTATLSVYNESCNTQVNVNKIAEEPIFEDGEYKYVTKPLEGALFAVYAREDVENYYGEVIAEANTCVGYAVTDEAGVASFNDRLIKGAYYYKELKSAGPQYVLDTQAYNFDLILDNSRTNVFNLNEAFPIKNTFIKGDIEVLKISEDGKVPLTGVEFDLYNSDDKVVAHLVTNEQGKAKTGIMPWGSYYLKETKALEGYQLEDTKFKVAVVEDGVTTVVTIENRKTPKLGATTMITITGLLLVLGVLVMSIISKLKKTDD